MKTLLKSPKNTFLEIFHWSGHFRPIPATNQIWKIKKIIKKSLKMRFSKIHILLHNGRKYDIWPELVLWTLESPQKVYINHTKQFGNIFFEKNAFLTIKIDVKKFSRPNLAADVDWPPKQLVLLPTDTPPYRYPPEILE